MNFHSILFDRPKESSPGEAPEPPEFFVDLNLHQIVEAITAPKQQYDLTPFFYISLHDINSITYRQEVAQDLETEPLWENLKSFATQMSTMRRYLNLSEKLYYKYHKEGWRLEALETYCEAVVRLATDLKLSNLTSRGLLAFYAYISDYVSSDHFRALLKETYQVKEELSSVRYGVIIKDDRVTVRKYELETDYTVEVKDIFAKFRQGEVKEYTSRLSIAAGMNHVEAQILDLVAKLHPEVFLHLDNYCTAHQSNLDETIATFDREIQFYVAYFEYISKLKSAGLSFCYPEICENDKRVHNDSGFDLALAHALLKKGSTVVCNDFYLRDQERIIVVSGPNQGGKTTFARTFGQLHYLASLGLPVPGKIARLHSFDRIFTHFEREERMTNHRGKLQDELIRMHDILRHATGDSVLIINEMLTSTTLQDAIFLGKKILSQAIDLDLLCVCVTFVDELASLSDKTVSMVSTVVPENPALRTFKIVRRPADGLSYAISIAEKYGLTYHCLKERIKS